MNEIEAFAYLASIPGLGSVKIKLLLEHFGSAIAAAEANASDIRQVPSFERIAADWDYQRKQKNWERDLELAAANETQLIQFTSPQFPKSLLSSADHPVLLYVRGKIHSQDHRSIAVVGTRQASIYGCEMAEEISKQLAANGFTVVSGLARGIDTAAHRGALQAGRTLAVIGSGLANIYPAENLALAQEICQQGVLISEFPMAAPPDRQNFPQRNRIVAGMTLGTLLIEAPIKSGAMITMEKASVYHRPLFALPGRADHDNFRGNHSLIKNGKALLIENAEDIIKQFEDLFPAPQQRSIHNNPIHFDAEEQSLLEKMPNQELTIDELAAFSRLPIQQLHRILMSLVLKKAIKEFPGKIYKKLAAGNTANRHN